MGAAFALSGEQTQLCARFGGCFEEFQRKCMSVIETRVHHYTSDTKLQFIFFCGGGGEQACKMNYPRELIWKKGRLRKEA